MRYEVCYKNPSLDGRTHRVQSVLPDPCLQELETLAIVDVYILQDIPELTHEMAAELFSDPVAQACTTETLADEVLPGWTRLVEIRYRPGVTDPVAITARDAVEAATGRKLEKHAVVQTARQYLFKERVPTVPIAEIAAYLHNPLVECAELIEATDWQTGRRLPQSYPYSVIPSSIEVEHFDVAGMDDTELKELSRTRLLALSPEETDAIRRYYSDPKVRQDRLDAGLPAAATDVEIEMIAQTWSEHCKHKILNADIEYDDGKTKQTIHSLFSTYIKGTTEELSETKKYLRSVFHDDSGVIEFDEETLVCFKVETHNSPSALDPYGGAITGIVGVNRDILGTGKSARPIFNTNVLCFGDPNTPPDQVPPGLLHPKRVMTGVHHGIVDGGNQSGIPVVAGAFVFDESYMGKPLVFCGTGGILPARLHGDGGWEKFIKPGDRAVMIGGRIGKDGIHGATFSSLALDDSSPTSAVQIGDPITQKKMTDLLMEARDQGLFRGITDNGAGGLSSSLGELAEMCGGIRIDLDACPLKYEGLAPWEILLSESQERMSLAIPPDSVETFLERASRLDVDAAVVGEFTDSGYVEIAHGGSPVGRLDLGFLHDGLPTMKLEAVWTPPLREDGDISSYGSPQSLKADLLDLLADPTIASKESLVRQYDHEVQAQSVVKPFVGLESDAPSDGAVLRPRNESRRGLTVTHGICPRYGDVDTYHMAFCAVDEAMRAHVACGGDPDYTSVLDNFCWPDPVRSESTPDGAYKLAQLVRACQGLRKACLAYGAPLISGKDSMKNDSQLQGKKVSVRPTLLVSLMGIIEDVRCAITTDFMEPGDLLYLVGETRGELGGSSYEKLKAGQLGGCPQVRPERALAGYRRLHQAMRKGLVRSCHDLSDGGIAVALCESALGGRLGAWVDLSALPGRREGDELQRLLFCETPSRLLVSVAASDAVEFERAMSSGGADFDGLGRVGVVEKGRSVTFARGDTPVFTVNLEEIEKAWKGTLR